MTWNWAWSLLGLLALSTRTLYADTLGDAYRAFEKGQFEEAAKGFQSHAQKKPDDYDQLYNTGVALFQKGAHEEAMSFFDRAMQSPDPSLKSRAAYNKGVALAQKQKWEEAEAAFQDALSYDNENKMIQDNLQFAREQKHRQKKEQPQENQAQQQNQQTKDAKADEKQAENQPGQPQNGTSEQKQADNQQGQSQRAEQKQAAQEINGQKAESKASAQAEEQKPAEGQKQAEALKQAEAFKQAQEKSSQTGQSAEKQADQKTSESDQQPQLAQPQAGKPDGQKDRDGQRVLTIKDLKKQEAEKLLRSVDDRIGTYILTPEQANTEGKSRNGKDW